MSDWHYSKYETRSERENMPKGFLTLLLIIGAIGVGIFLIVSLVIVAREHPEYFEHSLLDSFEYSAPANLVKERLIFI